MSATGITSLTEEKKEVGSTADVDVAKPKPTTQEQPQTTPSQSSYMERFQAWLKSLPRPDSTKAAGRGSGRLRSFAVVVGRFENPDDDDDEFFFDDPHNFRQLRVDGVVQIDDRDASLVTDEGLRQAVGLVLAYEFRREECTFHTAQEYWLNAPTEYHPVDEEMWEKQVQLDSDHVDLRQLRLREVTQYKSKFWVRVDKSALFGP